MDRTHRKWTALIGISIIAFMTYMEVTIVNTVLPQIQRDFAISVVKLQWVINGFLLTASVFTLLASKLGNIYGHRKIFYWGGALYTLGALGAGVSTNLIMLSFFRALQGIGSPTIHILGMGLMLTMYPKEEQKKPVAIYSIITGFGLSLGPLLGGLFMEYMQWRWVFLINVPIFLIGLLCCLHGLKKPRTIKNPEKIDWRSALFFSITMICLLLGITYGEEIGWNDPISWVFFIVCFVTIFALIINERKSKHPYIDLTIFKNRNTILVVILGSMGGVLTFNFLFFNPLFFESIQTPSPVILGLALLPMPIADCLMSAVFTNLIKKIRISLMILIAQVLGFVAAIMLGCVSLETAYWYFFIAFIMIGVSWGIASTGCVIATNRLVSQKQYASTAGTVFTVWNAIGSISLAVSVAILNRVEHIKMAKEVIKHDLNLSQSVQKFVCRMLSDPARIKSTLAMYTPLRATEIHHAFKMAFLAAYNWVAIFIAIVFAITILTCLFCLRSNKQSKSTF